MSNYEMKKNKYKKKVDVNRWPKAPNMKKSFNSQEIKYWKMIFLKKIKHTKGYKRKK
jgi:hypothetical protein